MKLSDHFQLEEFTRSATASRLNIQNVPNTQIIQNLTRICKEILEPLREYAGQPIIIGSGYRSPSLNKAVGGVPNSQHQTGEAVDIHIPDNDTGLRWFTWMMDNLRFDQLIKERNTKSSKSFWIHVSLKASDNRQHVIRNLVKSK